METSHFLPTILRQRRLIIRVVGRSLINLPVLLDRVLHRLGFPGTLLQLPKGEPSKGPSTSVTITTILDGVHVIDATLFSIGLGNITNDFADQLSSTRRETWVEK